MRGLNVVERQLSLSLKISSKRNNINCVRCQGQMVRAHWTTSCCWLYWCCSINLCCKYLTLLATNWRAYVDIYPWSPLSIWHRNTKSYKEFALPLHNSNFTGSNSLTDLLMQSMSSLSSPCYISAKPVRTCKVKHSSVVLTEVYRDVDVTSYFIPLYILYFYVL